MAAGGSEVFLQADKFADALLIAKEEMSPSEFLMLLAELNMKIEKITRIDYGSLCTHSSPYRC